MSLWKRTDVSLVLNLVLISLVTGSYTHLSNRPSYTECPELLRKTGKIVVFDHHRQRSEIIENPILSYIEPYASSACEMVAEAVSYTHLDVYKRQRIRRNEMKSILIIGMGKFGHHLCADLIKNGNDIMVMDKDEAKAVSYTHLQNIRRSMPLRQAGR